MRLALAVLKTLSLYMVYSLNQRAIIKYADVLRCGINSVKKIIHFLRFKNMLRNNPQMILKMLVKVILGDNVKAELNIW